MTYAKDELLVMARDLLWEFGEYDSRVVELVALIDQCRDECWTEDGDDGDLDCGGD